MYICGLVLTLASQQERRSVFAHLEDAGPFTLGEVEGRCCSLVMETTDPKSAHDWHDWVVGVPGVESVEVVFVHWEEDAQEVSHVHD